MSNERYSCLFIFILHTVWLSKYTGKTMFESSELKKYVYLLPAFICFTTCTKKSNTMVPSCTFKDCFTRKTTILKFQRKFQQECWKSVKTLCIFCKKQSKDVITYYWRFSSVQIDSCSHKTCIFCIASYAFVLAQLKLLLLCFFHDFRVTCWQFVGFIS